MQTAARGLGMMGMSGGYADSLKILFSKVGMDDVVWTNGDVDITGRMGEWKDSLKVLRSKVFFLTNNLKTRKAVKFSEACA